LSTAPTRVLLVDDDEELCHLVQDYLGRLGYDVDLAHDGRTGLDKLAKRAYSAVILDVMLPDRNGIDVLTEIRRSSQVPVLMLTALGDEPDRVAGLEIGADDYLPKTSSSHRELLARLRALLRRSQVTAAQQAPPAPAPVSVGELWLDPAARTASVAARPLTLTTIEFDILLSLARAAGRVKTREQLLTELVDRRYESFDRSIDVHVASLRKKLGDDARAPRFIETVRGVGYKLLRPERT
jgi:DNA-binding response OmpR family regulator